MHAFDDVARWAEARPADAPIDFPPLLWVACAAADPRGEACPDRSELVTAQGTLPWRFVPKIALNRSYADASTLAFFGERALMLRGEMTQGAFVARLIWPRTSASGRATRAGATAGEPHRK